MPVTRGYHLEQDQTCAPEQKKENHFNIGLSVVSKVEGKQEIVGRHAGSGKHRVLSGVR